MKKNNIIYNNILSIILISLLSISLINCNENKDSLRVTDEIDSFIIVRCPPKKTDSVRAYNIVEYSVPKFLVNYLDTVIYKEMNCRCYKSSEMNGFLLHSANEISDTLEITIVSNNTNIIGYYKNFTGYFKYREHYFICSKAFSHLPLKEIRNLTIIAYLPDKKFHNYDPETTWRLKYHDNKILSAKHYPCPH